MFTVVAMFLRMGLTYTAQSGKHSDTPLDAWVKIHGCNTVCDFNFKTVQYCEVLGKFVLFLHFVVQFSFFCLVRFCVFLYFGTYCYTCHTVSLMLTNWLVDWLLYCKPGMQSRRFNVSSVVAHWCLEQPLSLENRNIHLRLACIGGCHTDACVRWWKNLLTYIMLYFRNCSDGVTHWSRW